MCIILQNHIDKTHKLVTRIRKVKYYCNVLRFFDIILTTIVSIASSEYSEYSEYDSDAVIKVSITQITSSYMSDN